MMLVSWLGEPEVKHVADEARPVPPASHEQVPVEPRHHFRLEPVRQVRLYRLVYWQRL